jgi:DNA-binding response OmpR family regulator
MTNGVSIITEVRGTVQTDDDRTVSHVSAARLHEHRRSLAGPVREAEPPDDAQISVLIAESGDGLGSVLADRISNHRLDAHVATDVAGTVAAFSRNAFDVVLVPAFVDGGTTARLIAQLRTLPGGHRAIIAPYTQVPSPSLYAAYLEAGADQILTLPATTAHLRVIIEAAVRRLRELTELGDTPQSAEAC